MFCVSMGYPTVEDEAKMLKFKFENNSLDDVKPIIDGKGMAIIKAETRKVFVHDDVYMYISKIAGISRKMNEIELGISPRGSIAIMRAAQARAYIEGRNYVIPEDVNNIIIPCVRHRIVLSAASKAANETIENVVSKILKEAAR